MNQDQFVGRYRTDWIRAEVALDQIEKNRSSVADLADFPALYRRCCHHLAIARQRNYEASIEDRLHHIALRGHTALYRGRRQSLTRIARFLLAGFPRLVRQRARRFWLASALFYLPAIAAAVMVTTDPDTIYSLIPAEQVEAFERMYSDQPEAERGSAFDVAAFGFYIQNNISIAFRTFASGILAGVGTVFILVFNGLFFGALVANHIAEGLGENLLSFVVTHGALELTAIVISGVAGLELGAAVVAPGRLSRGEALRRGAGVGVRLIVGCTAMLLAAAFIEAFWSSTAWATPELKFSTGAIAWALVTGYLVFGGRRAA